MLLTLKQPGQHGFNKSIHDYSPPTPPSTSRFSPALTAAGPAFPSSTAAQLSRPPQSMSTPHRGLPPPAGMTLPQPQSTQPPPPPQVNQTQNLNQPLGQLPAPPQQWQGAEESMRNWLHAKSEEDKRKQEEEKTRQESLRLEQRKIESDMLRTSLSGGIPPYMIPLVFAGMGGGNLPNASLEWAQHYMAQTHQLQQQQHQQQQAPQQPSQQPLLPPSYPSPELRREARQIGHVAQHPIPAVIPSTTIVAPSGAPGANYYPMSPSSRNRQVLPGPAALVRSSQSGHLPRLNTGEILSQPPPTGQAGLQMLPSQPSHPLQQTQMASAQEPQQSSPSIYFHHWQPPATQNEKSGGGQPTTPSEAPDSPPRKRKATGPQQPAPPPTSQPRYNSPPFSQGRSSVTTTPARRRHSRQQSNMSSRDFEHYQARSRHRHTGSSFGSQRSGLSPPSQDTFEPTMVQESYNNPYASEVSEARQQRFSAGPELRQPRPLSADRDRDRKSPDREQRREAREALPSSAPPRGSPSRKRDDSRD